MSLGLLLWLLLSAALLGFMIWTFTILFRQKRAWRRFAERYKLRYKSLGFMVSPQVHGVFNDYSVALFVSEHAAEGARSSRKMSAIEVTLKRKLPVSGAIGSGDMVGLIQGLDYKEETQPVYEGWSKSYVALSRNKAFFDEYLNETRVKALTSLMKKKGLWVIFIAEGDNTLLRIDTANPLDDPKKIDHLMKAMVDVTKALELSEDEEKTLLAKSKSKPSPEQVVIDDPSVAPGFELEEE